MTAEKLLLLPGLAPEKQVAVAGLGVKNGDLRIGQRRSDDLEKLAVRPSAISSEMVAAAIREHRAGRSLSSRGPQCGQTFRQVAGVHGCLRESEDTSAPGWFTCHVHRHIDAGLLGESLLA